MVYHVGSGTSGSKYNAFKVKLAARNSVYLNYKNMPLPQLVLNAAPLALGMAVKRGFFKKIGFEKEYMEGLKEGFSTVKRCRKVLFCREHLKNYLQIEMELIAGLFIYTWEFASRKLSGRNTRES